MKSYPGCVVDEPTPAVPVRALPRDSRGYRVPAESPWIDGVPKLSKVEPTTKLVLTAHRACAVCGYALRRNEPVWRIYDHESRLTNHLQIANQAVLDNDVPGHLVCMLYSALVCPYWRSEGGRLGHDTMFTPGLARGSDPAIMGFQDYGVVLDPTRPIGGPDTQNVQIWLEDYVDEIRFSDPLKDLKPRYDTERLAVGGRYASGKRWHFGPDFGGTKRAAREGIAVVGAMNSRGPDGVMLLEDTEHVVFMSGWM